MSGQHTGVRALLGAALAFLLAACGASVPPELEQARAEFEQVAAGPAHELAPEAVGEAQAALEEAEEAFERHGDDEVTRTRAYVALRRAQLADVLAQLALERRRVASAQGSHQALAEALRGEQARELRGSAETPGEPGPSRAERLARVQAEARLLDARERLERVARVSDVPVGTSIVFPSEHLFAGSGADLLPPAFERLQRLADYLKQVPNRRVRVEAHTDAQRMDAWNLVLSEQRAQAVRSFLVSRGVAAERIRAAGYGESEPLESDATLEGRDANRRIEVIILRPSAR